MYTPHQFKEENLETLHAFIQKNPLGLLISVGADGPLATAVPFLFQTSMGGRGTLQCHVARANPQWQSLNGQTVLVVFQGVDTYISPSWYASKETHGKVVPTWNYVMVQARGAARVMDDAAWLKTQITALTHAQESQRPEPWQVSDAPLDYIDAEVKHIIGIEIAIETLEGKWKASQNRNLEDRKGVADNLQREGNTEMAKLVTKYGKL